jgi:putative glutamine amidotransferase
VNLPRKYVDAVRRAGGHPLLLAPGEPDLQGLVERFDALLLAGGGDVEPVIYGGEAHPSIYGTDPERDADELALARIAVDSGLPTLAICRGMQVLNVALGGTLHEHLPDVVGETVAHRAPPREPVPHGVAVESGSLVARTMGACAITPMSWHHQAIDRLADGLGVVARAPDGVVEAVELDDHPWIVAVQWHPELTAASDPTQQALFDGLVAAANGRGLR